VWRPARELSLSQRSTKPYPPGYVPISADNAAIGSGRPLDLPERLVSREFQHCGTSAGYVHVKAPKPVPSASHGSMEAFLRHLHRKRRSKNNSSRPQRALAASLDLRRHRQRECRSARGLDHRDRRYRGARFGAGLRKLRSRRIRRPASPNSAHLQHHGQQK
jgi:hypothetical protein